MCKDCGNCNENKSYGYNADSLDFNFETVKKKAKKNWLPVALFLIGVIYLTSKK